MDYVANRYMAPTFIVLSDTHTRRIRIVYDNRQDGCIQGILPNFQIIFLRAPNPSSVDLPNAKRQHNHAQRDNTGYSHNINNIYCNQMLDKYSSSILCVIFGVPHWFSFALTNSALLSILAFRLVLMPNT